MDTTVTLQDNFSVSPWPIIGIILVLIGIALLFLLPRLLKKAPQKKPKEAPVKQIVIQAPFDPQSVKSKYLKKVYAIQQDLQTGMTDERHASQMLSSAIRDFVNEMTGLNVQNYTLTEIRTLHMPVLEELISEYYAPEFSRQKGWDAQKSIEKTKKAINQWM